MRIDMLDMIILIEDIAYNFSAYEKVWFTETEFAGKPCRIAFLRGSEEFEYHAFDTIEEGRRIWAWVCDRINCSI